MTVRLPQKFVERMKVLLQEEWFELLAAWEEPGMHGLRINTLKIGTRDFLSRAPFALEEIPWADTGFYISSAERPAKHFYFKAGLFYLQEPSAMTAVGCLQIKPGERVLDLCAAPGGKTTQLAALLRGEGLLVSNDNNADRVKALLWNVERWGARNVVVTNEEPARLAMVFPQYFDKILIDAPCSGEGMFRKDDKAVRNWEEYSTEKCFLLQQDIITTAAKMLRPGGQMLYSTCTFSPQENEDIIAGFLTKNADFKLEELPLYPGWSKGRSEWAAPGLENEDLQKTRRLWPHKIRGEGHFLALLTREAKDIIPEKAVSSITVENNLLPWFEFMDNNLHRPIQGNFRLQGAYIYKIPDGLPSLQGLKVLRPGWFVGLMHNNRFEPSQALAMGLKYGDAVRNVSLPIDDMNVERYLKGETLMLEGKKGWTLVCLEEFPLGWGKQTENFIKNYYPPGWRSVE